MSSSELLMLRMGMHRNKKRYSLLQLWWLKKGMLSMIVNVFSIKRGISPHAKHPHSTFRLREGRLAVSETYRRTRTRSVTISPSSRQPVAGSMTGRL